MPIARPTRSVPGGCLIGFFALVALAFGGLCGYGLFLSYEKDNLEHVPTLWRCLAGSAVAFLVLTGIALAQHRNIGKDYDPFDRSEPRARF